jgi:hypothetical protein
MVLPKVIGALRSYAPKLAKPKVPSEKVLDLGKAKAKTTPLSSKNIPALFYNSREKILDAPFEKNTPQNWMNYLKNRGVKDKELYDTSTTFFLQDLGNKTLTKKDFIKEFDEIAPNLEVVALGEPAQKDIIQGLIKQMKKIDPKTQDPRVEGFVSYLQSSLPNALHETGNINPKALDKIAVNVDKYMKDVFGVESAMEKGLALTENVPFAVKEPLVALSSAMEKRGVGFKPKDFKGEARYRGEQMLPGGDNYRNFLFKYKPGKLRTSEPTYTYAHDFSLPSSARSNAFVHARVSDRTDEFGRRILFVEEIQSDMHQPIQRAIREAKTAGKPLSPEKGYARRGDLPTPQEILVNKQQLDLITLKIENLLNTNPRSKALPKLEKERDKIRTILEEAKAKKGVGGGDVPEGPFQTSQEYMEFVAKYLTRVAKDGKYDGVAFANPRIKNRRLSPGNRDYNGNLAAYGPILNKALINASKKTGANLLNTVIKDTEGRIYGNVKLLNLKGNTMAEEIISKGVSAYRHGGVVNGR